MPAGMRPYMEDRSAVVASFTPQSAAGGPMRDGVLRSFAAIYDGHNGAHSATYCSTRCGALGSAASVCRTAAAQRNATDMRDSLPMQCCMPMPAHQQQMGPQRHEEGTARACLLRGPLMTMLRRHYVQLSSRLCCSGGLQASPLPVQAARVAGSPPSPQRRDWHRPQPDPGGCCARRPARGLPAGGQ